jgi:hypothetical protein
MRRTTFILGAGFSAAAQFPLVRGLKELVIDFVEAERHAIYTASLEPGRGFERGEFYEGLKQVDEHSQRGFEELLIALRHICATADGYDPRHATLRVLRIGCARLLWQRQNAIRKAPLSYENFAKRFFKPAELRSNVVISFNWDLLMERSLQDVAIPWDYSSGVPGATAVLKPHGSINWSSWMEGGGHCAYEGWRAIVPQSKLSFDVTQPFADPDVDEINPDSRYMLFPGDPELPEQNTSLKLIWSDVQTALEQSEALVFLGYSLPEYDCYSAEIFRRYGAGKEIEVYNPSAEHLQHFRRQFGGQVGLFPLRFEECPYAQAL